MTLHYSQVKGGPMYHPARDIAYISAKLVSKALDNITDLEALDYKAYLEQGGSEEELGASCQQLGQMFRDFTGNEEVTTVEELMDKSLFNKQPLRVRQLIAGRVFNCFIGASFGAVRDTVYRGDGMREDLKALIETAEKADKVLRKNVQK